MPSSQVVLVILNQHDSFCDCCTYNNVCMVPGGKRLQHVMLWQVIRVRLGHAIKGHIDDVDRNVIFTEQFVARHRAKICGMFSAATK